MMFLHRLTTRRQRAGRFILREIIQLANMRPFEAPDIREDKARTCRLQLGRVQGLAQRRRRTRIVGGAWQGPESLWIKFHKVTVWVEGGRVFLEVRPLEERRWTETSVRSCKI